MNHRHFVWMAIVAGIAILLVSCGSGPAAAPKATPALPQVQPTPVSGSVTEHLAAADEALNANDLVAA